MDEWFGLARQHMDRFAFDQARQAVDNVLQIRPADPQALDLMAEIQRREQQYLQLRQEKEKLYQSAVADYEKAELSGALNKLERVLEIDPKAPDLSSTESGSSYQSFYNQVRSEQDANMSAYAEARRSLTDGNFDRADEITEEALKKFPGQALFQALRFDIEDRKRQKLSAYMAEVDRNVDAEPDLDKRFDILSKASAQFPEEQHFARALRLTREKRDLVNSIAGKARRQEEQAQYGDALAQWEILRTVYGQYPGLDVEVERVTNRRGQQIQNEAKARWTEQIHRQIEARDFVRAASVLREAQAEFPGDTELEELAKLINQGEERNARTQGLVDQARALVVHGRFDQATILLRKAYDADERDTGVRGLLVDTLLQQARSLLDGDWKRAGELVDSALKLDPNNAQARSMSALVVDRKRDEAIDQCANRVRQLQSAGDVPAALSAVEQLLAIYPAAPRLAQLKATLQRASVDDSRVQSRRADLEKLVGYEAKAQTAKEPHEQRAILDGVRELAAKYLDDPEFQIMMIAMEKRYVGLNRAPLPAATLDEPSQDPRNLETQVAPASPIVPRGDLTMMIKLPEAPVLPAAQASAEKPTAQPIEAKVLETKPPEIKSPAAVPPPPVPTIPPPVAKTPPPPPPPPVKPAEIKTAPIPIPVAVPTSKKFADAPPTPESRRGPIPPPPSTPAKPAPTRNGKLWAAFVGGFAVVAALGFGAITWLQHRPPAPETTPTPSGPTVAVTVHTDPEGATLVVDDKVSGTSNLVLNLAPGTHRLNAVREGYRPYQTELTVAAGHATPLNITLQAIPTTLRVLTDFTAANITFDGKPQNNLQSGQLILDTVAGGSHVLTVGSGTAGAAIKFEARDGGPPVVTSLEAAKETSAILITNLGGKARIYSNQKAGTVTLDGKPAGSLDPLGVELTNLGPGDHEITIGDGDQRRKVVYETALVPALTVYLNNVNQQPVGNLLITTGEDDVQVSLDGKPIRVLTRRGQLRLPNVPAKQYVISVAKNGFEPVPEQHVTVKKGEDAKVAFQLHPIPAISTFHLTGAMPGTQVLVDGKSVGTVGQDGTLAATQLAPGSHAVVLHKEDYKPKTFQLNFAAGKEVTLSGADVAMEGTFGTLVVAVNPPGAQVTIQRSGETQSRPLTSNSVHLAEGSYTVTAAAPHFNQQSTTVEIAVGGTKNITLQLAPERAAVAPKTAVRLGMAGWQFPAAWQPDGDHFTRKGGNLVLFSPQGPGTYSFAASMKHGKQLRWVAHVVNEKNYVEFEVDNEYFYRRQVIDGKNREVLKKKHGLPMQPAIAATVQVTISPAGISQRIQRPDGWVTLDNWADPSLHEGRFGFLIRGRDEVNLSGFWFSGSE